MTVFVPAIWMAAGISLFAGVHFLLTGLARRQERVYFAFGQLCILLAVYMHLSALWYREESVADLAPIARAQMAIVCLIYPTFVWYLGLYRKTERPWVAALVAALPFGIFFFINFWSPYSFLYSDIEAESPIQLPWGESLSHFHMVTSHIAPYYYIATYGVFAWAIYSSISLWRLHERAKAVSLALYLLVQIASVVHAEMIDNLQLNSVYLGEFAFLALVILMSNSLGRELRHRTLALESSIADLYAETRRRHEVEQELRHMAYHDALTELPNRRQLQDYLSESQAHCLRSGRHGALLLFDLDHFKTINDSLGHDVGDELLQRIAEQLRTTLRDGAHPTRLGGDEFAVVLEELSANRAEAETQALHAAQALVAGITRPFTIGNHELAVGVSTGIALFSGSEANVIRQADMALYRAKNSGRNTTHLFVAGMQQDADERLVLEKGLRVALEHGELALHYQPQVDRNGRVIGAEALLRWHHPRHGVISPQRFIPIAEETGLIHPLGDFVLRSACDQLRVWQQTRYLNRTRLSVNVSAWQLAASDFTEKVMIAAEHGGIDVSPLTLEITESSFLRDVGSVREKLDILSKTGIEFSIDDFGTGYSSLAWLKQLPLHELKIDRLFVRDMAHERHDKFIETIIAIARHMDMRVIAEGVETLAQRTSLNAMGCHGVQGNYICPPLDAAAFMNWAAVQAGQAGGGRLQQE